jgi:cytochrome c oxidase subunit 2
VTEPTLGTVPAAGTLSERDGYPSLMRRYLRILGLLALSSGTLLLTSCSNKNISGLGFPKGVSSVNDTSGVLWYWAWVTAGIVGVSTFILLMWPVVFHRKKSGEFPSQTRYNIPVEVAYTLIPFVIVAVLFAYTVRDQSRITKVESATTAAHNISINAIQWSWQFTYKDAATAPTVTGTPAQRPELVLPLGEKVLFTLTASDVDHGFWIPAFMIQMQALPHITNHLEFAAEKLGTFPGRCNILCGREHSQMLFTIKVVTPSQYTDYINSLKAA